MRTLNLTAKGREQELIKQYLEEHASEVLAEKINNGVSVEKDGKTLINRKTLDGFMKFANEEARKQAEKGAQFACVEDRVVFGWAIHYFEEESIIGTLYNEDGTEYTPPKPVVKTTPKKTTTAQAPTTAPKIKKQSDQLSLFDFSDDVSASNSVDDSEVNTEDDEIIESLEEPDAVITDETPPIVEKPKKSPLYEKYTAFAEQYPNAIIAMRVGDFYEVFGDNAKLVSEKLELTLVGRDIADSERIAMVGFPYHKEEIYRNKIREFANLAVIETDGTANMYLKITDDGAAIQVDTTTGEIIEPKIDNRADELIAIMFKILGNEMEVKL